MAFKKELKPTCLKIMYSGQIIPFTDRKCRGGGSKTPNFMVALSDGAMLCRRTLNESRVFYPWSSVLFIIINSWGGAW